MGYGQQLAIKGAFGSHPEIFRSIKGQFLPIEVSLEKLKAFDQALTVCGYCPSIEASLNELRKHSTPKRGIYNGSSLQKILIPSTRNDSSVAQHHDSLTVFQLLLNKSLVYEGVGANDLD